MSYDKLAEQEKVFGHGELPRALCLSYDIAEVVIAHIQRLSVRLFVRTDGTN